MKRSAVLLAVAGLLGAVATPGAWGARSPSPALSVLPGLASGHSGDVALDVSSSGVVVGAVETEPPTCCSGPRHAVRWLRGEPHDLGTLGGAESEARAVNARGEIVGWSDTTDLDAAFLWRRGVMRALWTGAANDLNDHGEVVGQVTTLAGPLAVRWRDGTLVELPTLGGSTSEALAVNANGVAVGWATDAAGDTWAVRWVDGRAEALWRGIATDVSDEGTIVGALACGVGVAVCGAVVQRLGRTEVIGGPDTVAHAVNAGGLVVGEPAFVWSPGGALVALPVTPPQGAAYGINDGGLVVGTVGFAGDAALWR
jgi:probable HAF family extracellular repeat protein